MSLLGRLFSTFLAAMLMVVATGCGPSTRPEAQPPQPLQQTPQRPVTPHPGDTGVPAPGTGAPGTDEPGTGTP